MHIRIAGEDALIVYLGEETSPVVSTRVQVACERIAAALGEALVDLVPSYASVLVIYDPLQGDHLLMQRRVENCLADLPDQAAGGGRLVTLPAWYDPACGPDLEALAEELGRGDDQVLLLANDISDVVGQAAVGK